MPKQRRLRVKLPALKPRNKALNDLLMAKSKRGGLHKDKRREINERELQKKLKELE